MILAGLCLELFDFALLKTRGMKIFPLVFAAWIELTEALLFLDQAVMFILLLELVVRFDFFTCILGLNF